MKYSYQDLIFCMPLISIFSVQKIICPSLISAVLLVFSFSIFPHVWGNGLPFLAAFTARNQLFLCLLRSQEEENTGCGYSLINIMIQKYVNKFQWLAQQLILEALYWLINLAAGKKTFIFSYLPGRVQERAQLNGMKENMLTVVFICHSPDSG